MAEVEPLSDVAGARITGVDLSRPMREADFTRVETALHEHCFVVFPRQTLSASQFVAFSRLWGRPEPHVIDTFHHPQEPNILVLSNVSRDGKPIGLVDAGTYFHTDYSYLEVPARCTILFAIQVPRRHGGTTFANQTRAYDDLPAQTRERIDGLVVRHHYGNRDDTDSCVNTRWPSITWTNPARTVRRGPAPARRPRAASASTSTESGLSAKSNDMTTKTTRT
mgnify:CR=1 FL=1